MNGVVRRPAQMTAVTTRYEDHYKGCIFIFSTGVSRAEPWGGWYAGETLTQTGASVLMNTAKNY